MPVTDHHSHRQSLEFLYILLSCKEVVKSSIIACLQCNMESLAVGEATGSLTIYAIVRLCAASTVILLKKIAKITIAIQVGSVFAKLDLIVLSPIGAFTG